MGFCCLTIIIADMCNAISYKKTIDILRKVSHVMLRATLIRSLTTKSLRLKYKNIQILIEK